MASYLVWLSYMSIFVWGTVTIHMSLLDSSRHAHVAPNTGMLRNTHIIMHAAEHYMFCTPGFKLWGEPILVLDVEYMDLYMYDNEEKTVDPHTKHQYKPISPFLTLF